MRMMAGTVTRRPRAKRVSTWSILPAYFDAYTPRQASLSHRAKAYASARWTLTSSPLADLPTIEPKSCRRRIEPSVRSPGCFAYQSMGKPKIDSSSADRSSYYLPTLCMRPHRSGRSPQPMNQTLNTLFLSVGAASEEAFEALKPPFALATPTRHRSFGQK
jgi:hypothetical protein